MKTQPMMHSSYSTMTGKGTEILYNGRQIITIMVDGLIVYRAKTTLKIK